VAGKEVDEVHASFSWIANCKLAVNVTFEKPIIFLVRNWSWYGAALAMLEQGCGQWPVWDP
jgi:hypothetical protein